MEQLLLPLLVAMATTPGFALVSDCFAVCYASGGSHNMRIQQQDCRWSNREIMNTQAIDLELTPVLNSTFNTTCDKSPEVRWLPGLNITWSTRPNVAHHLVHISELPLNSGDSTESKCFSFDAEQHHVQNVTRCSYMCRRVTSSSVFVRVQSNTSEEQFMGESIINFHEDFNHSTSIYRGLSLFFRRPLVPKNLTKGLLPNPRHWATIINVRNESYGQVSLTFDLAPEDVMVKHYNVLLGHTAGTWKTVSVYVTNETIGSYTFYNVTPGTYRIRVETHSVEKSAPKCMTMTKKVGGKPVFNLLKYNPCQNKATSYCLHVDTGIFVVSSLGSTRELFSPTPIREHHANADTWAGPPQPPVPTQPHTEPVTSGILVAAILGVLVPLLVIVSITFVAVKILKSRCRPPRPQIATTHAEPISDITDVPLPMVTVLLVYSRDNPAHITMVTKFAQLLRVVGHCHVLLDMEDSTVYGPTAVDWVLAKFRDADKVIFIKSEGALRRLERRYAHQEDTSHGQFFRASVSHLEASMLSENPTTCCLVVTLPYSNLNKLPDDKLRCILGSTNQYDPIDKLNDLLLAIHHIPLSRAGRFRRWCSGPNEPDVLNTVAYQELLMAVKEAEMYHRKNPDWFYRNYGDPEPLEVEGLNPHDFARHTSPESQGPAAYVRPLPEMTFFPPSASMERLKPPCSEDDLEDLNLYSRLEDTDSPLLQPWADVGTGGKGLNVGGFLCEQEQFAGGNVCETWQHPGGNDYEQEQFCESGFRSWPDSIQMGPAEGSLERTPPRYNSDEGMGSCTPESEDGLSSPESVTSSLMDAIDREGQLHAPEWYDPSGKTAALLGTHRDSSLPEMLYNTNN